MMRTGALDEVSALPMTKVEPTKPPYERNFADGQKNIAPELDSKGQALLDFGRKEPSLTERVQCQTKMNPFLWLR
jgi:hypothetical protein